MNFVLISLLNVVIHQDAKSEVVVLVLPAIREMTPSERAFALGKPERGFLEALEKIDVPGASAYVSFKPETKESAERRQRVFKFLSQKVNEDGSVDGSKVSTEEFNDVCQTFYGLDSKLTKNFPSLGLETTRTFQFNVDGKTLSVKESRGGRPSSIPAYSAEEMVNLPKDMKTVTFDPKNPPPVPLPTEFQGVQVLFPPNSLPQYERARIVSDVTKAFAERERKEFERISEMMDKAFYKMKYSDDNVLLNGTSVPKSALKTLAENLRASAPQKYKSIDEATQAIQGAKLMQTTYSIGVSMYQKNGPGVAFGVAQIQSQTIRP